jgi:hypothetical protein
MPIQKKHMSYKKQFKYKEAIDNFYWQKKRAQKNNTDFIISKIFDCSLKV